MPAEAACQRAVLIIEDARNHGPFGTKIYFLNGPGCVPAIGANFAASPGRTEWVVLGYLLAMTAPTLG